MKTFGPKNWERVDGEPKKWGEGKGGSVKVLTFGNYFFWRAPLS